MSTTESPRPAPNKVKSASPPGRRALSTSRYEVIFDTKPWERISLDGAVEELRSLRSLVGKLQDLRTLGDRVGYAVGHAYARAAGLVLAKFERMEDATAERNHRQKSKSKS